MCDSKMCNGAWSHGIVSGEPSCSTGDHVADCRFVSLCCLEDTEDMHMPGILKSWMAEERGPWCAEMLWRVPLPSVCVPLSGVLMYNHKF